MCPAPEPRDDSVIHNQITERFLTNLAASGADADLVTRLRAVLTGEHAPTEVTIKAAIENGA
jgi:hypothetical protein